MNKTSLGCLAALLAIGLLVGTVSAQPVPASNYPATEHIGTTYYIGPNGGSPVEDEPNYAQNAAIWTWASPGTLGWSELDTLDFTAVLPYQQMDPYRIHVTGAYGSNWDRHYDVAAIGTPAYAAGIEQPGYNGALQVMDVVFDDAHTSANNVNLWWWIPVGNLTLNRTGGFTFNGPGNMYLAGNVTVLNAATYNLGYCFNSLDQYGRSGGWDGTNDSTYGTEWYTVTKPTFTVAAGGVVNVNTMNGTFAGAGVTNMNGDGTCDWTFTPGSTLNCSTPDWATVTSMNGSGATVNLAGNYRFVAANYTYAGQVVFNSYTNGSGGTNATGLSFVLADGTTPATGATGLNLKFMGATSYSGLETSTPQTYADCTFTGDGQIVASSQNANRAGNTVAFTSQGCTFAVTNTGAFCDTTQRFYSGVFSFVGNLVLDKSPTTGKNTKFVFAVTGNGGALGTDFTQFKITDANNFGQGATGPFNSVVSSVGSTNAFANADLTVNITPGLSTGVHSAADLGTAKDPFAGQTLAIITSVQTDGVTASQNFTGSSFANIKIVGGSATVSYINGAVTLSNIFSNPTLPGDINNDGLVDVADYNIWAANVGKTGATWLQGDLNGDGLVDVADYNIWAANVGKTAATPEPISMIILAIGGGLVALKRRNA
jgi:hypothetical protein